ncbi:3-deoxy-7-phosphoheptulonate synthase [Candidatus Woesearchaeota archaeon CG_4_10_14_0_2_um_filter_57_5]|nr:MAG: 3-deoxy-7-phosphoheptulonate synthase [Candidatus Woesearchaeota archaeon CG_4_10_14_0_2_um_filter_57_5]
MIVKMDRMATKGQKDKVVARIKALGLDAAEIVGTERSVLGVRGDVSKIHEDQLRLPGVQDVYRISKNYKLASKEYHQHVNGKSSYTSFTVGNLSIGNGKLVIMAGPCTVESEEQIMASARAVKEAGGDILRGGAFKPRTSPYAFEGLGEEGLALLAKARDKYGLPVVTEIMSEAQLPLFEKYDIDIIQVGSRNGRNFHLLNELGKQKRPVFLKREMGTLLEEWLLCAERIMSHGNTKVILCERGITTFEKYTRNTLDLNSVAAIKYELSHLPIFSDPSHGTGRRNLIMPMSLASVAAGADGLMIEMHPRPEEALTDAFQQVTPETLAVIIRKARAMHTAVRDET